MTAYLGALIGFSLPLASAAANSVSIVDFIVWAVVGLLVQLAAFFVARATLDDLSAASPTARWRPAPGPAASRSPSASSTPPA